MSAFRDDRQAMLERLEQLEQELADVRGERDPAKREELLRELATLTARVESAATRVDEDRRALDEIGKGIERLRTTIGGGASTSSPPSRDGLPTSAAASGTSTKVGLVLLLVALPIGGLAISALSRRPAPSAEDSSRAAAAASIAGFPAAVDPLAIVPLAKQVSRLGPTAQLTGIKIWYVGSTGRVDFGASAYEARIQYSFTTPPPPAPPSDPNVPLGAPTAPPPMASRVSVEVTKTGMRVGSDVIGLADVPLEDPACPLEMVWGAARGAGAPSGAVAVLEYTNTLVTSGTSFRRRPHWTFTILGTAIRYEIDEPSCALIK